MNGKFALARSDGPLGLTGVWRVNPSLQATVVHWDPD